MNTDKRTIKMDMDSNQITNIKDPSYLLSVFIGVSHLFRTRCKDSVAKALRRRWAIAGGRSICANRWYS